MGNIFESQEARLAREHEERGNASFAKGCCVLAFFSLAFLILGWVIYSNYIYECSQNLVKCKSEGAIDFAFAVKCCNNEQSCSQQNTYLCENIDMSATAYHSVMLTCIILSILGCCCGFLSLTDTPKIKNARRNSRGNIEYDLLT